MGIIEHGSFSSELIRDFFVMFCYIVDSYSLSVQFNSDENSITSFAESAEISKLFFSKLTLVKRKEAGDAYLYGCLNLLFSSLNASFWFQKEAYSPLREKMIEYLFQNCLFKFEDDFPVCQNSVNRRIAFSCLSTLCKSESFSHLVLYKLLHLLKNMVFPDDWHYNPFEQERSECGYVGLYNLGCICYMNASLQQLFFSLSVRKGILEAVGYELPPIQENESNSESLPHKNAYFIALQELFSELTAIKKKATNPGRLCSSYVNLDGRTIDITEQMDANEFINILFDKIDNTLKGTEYEKLLVDNYGGKFSNQIKCKVCNNVSEREEPFYTLSVNTKDKKNIIDALSSFVEGEVLSGSNAYFCSVCNEKQTAIKRTCVKTLPKTLILGLKRFEFNYDEMIKVKLNDYIEFPLELDMYEFTKDHFDEENSEKSRECKYDLIGVLVHSGTADAGHYYSYIKGIKEDGTRGGWIEFNDQEVVPFDSSLIPEKCFGGIHTVDQFDRKVRKTVRRTIPRSNNAYMLFYEKRDGNSLDSDVYSKAIALPDRFLPNTTQQNLQFLVEKSFFDNHLFEFIWQLLQNFHYGFEDVCVMFLFPD
jgi:ubiquitin C-terminal hydrolase